MKKRKSMKNNSMKKDFLPTLMPSPSPLITIKNEINA